MADARADVPDPLEAAIAQERPPRLSPGRIVLSVLGGLLALALLTWVLPLLTESSWGEIARAVGRAHWWTIPSILLLAVAALAVDAVGLAAVMPSLRWRSALRIDAVVSAVAVAVPGGGTFALAVLYLLARRRGLRRAEILGGATLGSLVDLCVVALLPMIGILAYLASGSEVLSTGGLLTMGAVSALTLVAMVALVAVLAGRALPRIAHSLAQTVGAMGIGPGPEEAPVMAEDAVRTRDEARELLRARWARILLPPVLVRVLQCLMLAVAAQGAGLDLSPARTVAVFALGRLLALVPLTPGGTGITEAGTAGALVALGAHAAGSAAAALLMLVGTLIVPLALGALGLWAVARDRANARRP